MSSNNSFRCFIIGIGTLPIQCGQILLNNGHAILGLSSPDAAVRQWAVEQAIPPYASAKNLAEILAQEPFDYLFSIFNHTILKADSLALPRKLTINLHDALLPAYAGLNATAWALLRGEREHGISWHVVNEGIDTGDILKQPRVSVAADDTTLTLNLKIYEAAIASFTELVTELEQNTIQPRAQNPAGRSYFSHGMKPSPGGILVLNQPAGAIDAFVRATEFGPMANTFGAAKLVNADKAAVVTKVQVQSTPSAAPPGTVTRIENDFVQFCTADFDIRVLRLTTLTGAPLTVPQFVSQFDLRVGDRFPDLDTQQIERVRAVEQTTDPHEAFWVKRILESEPLPFPYVREARTEDVTSENIEYDMPLPAIVRAKLQDIPQAKRALWLAGAFVAWLARVGDVGRVEIGIQTPGVRRLVEHLETFFSPVVPLRLDADQNATLDSLAEEVGNTIDSLAKRKTFTHDVFTRHPSLRGEAPPDKFRMPVVIQFGEWDAGPGGANGSQLTVRISDDGTEWSWSANATLLRQENLCAAGESLGVFLEAAAARPQTPFVTLPVVPAAELELLRTLNATAAEYPDDKCIHELFEEWVERTPDKIALIFQQEELSYRELNGRANQLAHYLTANGVGSGKSVGLAIERSCEMVIGMLGVLKSGGAYVPLDPQYPPARLRFMLEDAAPEVLLTQDSLRADLPAFGGSVICLDSDWDRIAKEPTDNPCKRVTTQDLAYIIYTSGSTGNPKGVMAHHGAVVNALDAETVRLGLTADDRFLAIASLSFDASTIQILQPLTHGGSVVIADTETMRDGVKLAVLLDTSGTTVLDTAPVTLREMIDTGWKGNAGLTLNIGGSELERDLAENLFRRTRTVWNAYGLTEITIESVAFRVQSGEGRVPIGVPMQNSTAYVLDSRIQRLPMGVAGELYLGGYGVARGYLSQPDLTRERFIPNPFEGEREGNRRIPSTPILFKTGDRARYLPDGNLEYLGRADRQIKLRGFRIEPGEIEAAMCALPRIKEAVVILSREGLREPRLVAYLTAEGGERVDETMVRRALAQKLPDYMVPSAYVALERFPLSPNGKIDRRALPAPPLQTRSANPADNEFLDETERKLAAIWEDVLRVRPIGPNDNFFELGGQSLIATRMFSQIMQTFGIKVPIATLFRAPTIRELAQELRAPSEKSRARTVVAIQPNGSLPPFFCVHGFGGGVIGFADLAKQLGPDQPFYGLQAHGLGAGQEPDRRFETMAARYVNAMRQVQPKGPYHIGGYCYGGVVAYEMARQLEEAGERVAVLAILEGYAVRYDDARKELLQPRGMVRFVQNLPFWMMDYGPRRIAKAREQRQKHLLSPEQREWMRVHARRMVDPEEFLPQQVAQPEQMQVRVAHAVALEDYRMQPYHGCVTLFRVRALSLTRCMDEDMGWGRVAASVEIRRVPGKHHNILEQPYVEQLAKALREVMDKARRGNGELNGGKG